MKAVLLSDTHLGLYKASDMYHEVTLNLFKSVVDTCERNNIDTIIHLGDWFHNRTYISLKTIDYALEISDLLAGYNVYIIVGNHDTFYKTQIEPTSLNIYNKINNINIIKAPTVIDNITLVPWSTQYTEDDFNKMNTDYLFGHLGIDGFMMNTYYKFTGGLPQSIFKKFKRVLLGHFHLPSTIGNIEYIGAPYQQRFGDIGDRGYYIFDDGELEFIEFTGAPKYVKVLTEATITKQEIEGNIVNLIYEKDYGKTENNNHSDRIKELNPLQLYTDFSNISTDDTTDDIKPISKPTDSIELLYSFIDTLSFDSYPNIKIPMLKKIITSLTDEIK